MDTSVDRARAGPASAKSRHGLTEAKLRELQLGERAHKVSDGKGLYVVVSPRGIRSFRYDYRLSGRRETLTIGRRRQPGSAPQKNAHAAPNSSGRPNRRAGTLWAMRWRAASYDSPGSSAISRRAMNARRAVSKRSGSG